MTLEERQELIENCLDGLKLHLLKQAKDIPDGFGEAEIRELIILAAQSRLRLYRMKSMAFGRFRHVVQHIGLG